MADTIHDLAITLSLTAPTLASAAQHAMAQFTGIKAEAMAADRAVLSLQEKMAFQEFAGLQHTAAYQWNLQQIGVAADTAAAAHDRLNQKMSGMNRMMVGGAMTIGGIGILDVLGKAVGKAAELQTVMMAVQVATKATPSDMAALNQQAINIGATNQMSNTDVARIMSAEVGAGITLGARAAGLTPTQMVQQMTPSLANLGEVLSMTKGMAPETSAKIGVEFAHLFGAYSPKEMAGMTNTLGRTLFSTPSSPEQLLNLVSQFAGQLRPLYGNSASQRQAFITDAIQVGGLESILGQQTRGGTQIAQIVSRSMALPASQRSSAQIRADREMERISGRHFANADGSFAGLSNAFEIMGAVAAREKDPRITATLFKNAFGAVGGRQAGLLADPSTLAAFTTLGTTLGPKGIASMADIQQAYNQTEQGQMNQARKNLDTLVTVVGVELVPTFTDLARTAAQVVHGLTDFATKHPDLTKAVVEFVALGAAAMAIAGPILVIGGALAVLGIGLGPFLLFGAALAAGILIITHWGDIVKTVGAAFSAFGTGLHGMITWMQDHIPGFKALTDQGKLPNNSGKLPTTGPAYLVPNTRGGVDTAGPGLTSIYAAASKAYGIPLKLLLAQGAKESDFHNVAQRGGKGLGLAQWDFSTPDNIKNAMHYLGATSEAQAKQLAMNPHIAIIAQARYDADLQRRWGADWMSHYNGSGPAAQAYGTAVTNASKGVQQIVINVDARGAHDPAAVKAAGKAGVKEALVHVHTDIFDYVQHGTLGGNSLTLARHHPG